MLEVEQVRAVEVRWHVMRLAVLNEPSRRAARAVRDLHGRGPGGRRAWCGRSRSTVTTSADSCTPRSAPASTTGRGARTLDSSSGALAEVGLPAELIDSAAKDEDDAEVRATHKEGIELVGQDVGTPVIAVPGPTASRSRSSARS